MNCFQCGAKLNESAFCPNCGATVVEYKKIMRISNALYNDGLAKAKVRSLSGAADSLRRSLKYNKYHIDARNLLGLVYMEMGDGVHALAEWSISISLKPTDNRASGFLAQTQNDAVVMDRMRQSVKKYNMAVSYVRTGNEDLAVIQLKKVLELEPRMVMAYQMLALLYMKRREFGKARKVLVAADNIDTNNTQTLFYVKELARISRGRRTKKERLEGIETNEDRILYKSGNETIVQPTGYKDNNWMYTFLNVAIGIAIGLAAAVFLILPVQVQSVKREYQAKEKQLYAHLEVTPVPAASVRPAGSAKPQESAEPADASAEPERTPQPGASGEPKVSKQPDASAQPAAGMTPEEMEVFGNPEELEVDTGRSAEYYYELAQQNFSYEEYEDSKQMAQQALQIDPEHLESLYYLGRSYQRMDQNDKALVVYRRMVELYPDSTKWQIQDAKKYIEELQ